MGYVIESRWHASTSITIEYREEKRGSGAGKDDNHRQIAVGGKTLLSK